MEHIYTIGHHLSGNAIEVAACGYSLQATAKLGSQRASLSEQFEAHLCHAALFL